MAVLYVQEQGAILKRRGEMVTVVKEGAVLQEAPVLKLTHVLVFGNVQLTAAAMELLLEKGVDVGVLSSRGKLRGKLVSMTSKNLFLRMAQYDRWRDQEFKMKIARTIVRGKLRNQRALLVRHRRDHPEVPLEGALGRLEAALGRVDAAADEKALMGVEGDGSAAYFGAFGQMVRGGFDFPGRQQHPAPDPVNALLSLGYVLLTNELAGLLDAMSFDPYFGFLHGIRYGRMSLALDLVEQFRQPLVDRFTLHLVNNRMFQPGDFEPQADGATYLGEEARKRYFAQFAERMLSRAPGSPARSWRECLRVQVEALRTSVMEGGEYGVYTVVE